jgi:AraC-like DNA-binding protein
VPGYQEFRVGPRLARYVSCTWSGGARETGDAEPVLPDACMDIMWDGLRLFVAGPDTGPSADSHAGSFIVGLRFRPGMGPLFLGPPAVALRDARVDLEQLWPGDAMALAERLCAAPSPRVARAILADAVAGRVPSVEAPDRVVEFAARAWRADPAAVRTSSLAGQAGLSERQLYRRFVDAVGYGPKYLQRVLRFQAFLALSAAPGLSLADVAYRCGFADQAHLTRETAALSGLTPVQLRVPRSRDGRNLQDLACG